MEHSWRFSYEAARYVPDPEDPRALEVTALGDPERSFIPASRDPSPAELAEFRAMWLVEGAFIQRGPFGAVILPPEPHGIVYRPREPSRAEEPRRGQCQDCGLDDLPVDGTGRCRYCGELTVLKARNLPGPRLSGWWMTVPAALALALLTALVYAVASVILAG